MTATDLQQRVPAVGEPAPDFTLESTEGRKVSLSEYRGRSPVLLAFFPLAFTSTCTAELCDMRDDYDRFAQAGVVVHPISVDSVPTLKVFREQLGIGVEFLSDFRRDVSKSYGVFLPERFFSNRAYFLVDRDGTVRWAHVEEHPGKRRENAEILEHIGALSSAKG